MAGSFAGGEWHRSAIFDIKTTSEQRDALGQILMGKEGNSWFEVIASLVTNLLEPKVAPLSNLLSRAAGALFVVWGLGIIIQNYLRFRTF